MDVATKDHFSGWSGNCNTGRLPVALTLWRIDNGRLVNVPVKLDTGPRRDAAGWMAGTCNRPFDPNVGWSLVPITPEPPGSFLYVVMATDIPGSWYCGLMPPGYPNSGQMVCDYATNAVYRIVKSATAGTSNRHE